MPGRSSKPLQPLLWIGLPMLLSIAATVLLAAPLRVFGFGLPEPFFPMVLAFAWAVIRPSVLGPFALLLIGLFNDFFWGGPIGMWPFALLTAYFGALLARSLMVGQSGRVLWGWYAALTVLAFACADGVIMLTAGVFPDPASTAMQLLVTVALYPLANRLIERFEDADVRFR
jgi:rod shape-determining protein MreD